MALPQRQEYSPIHPEGRQLRSLRDKCLTAFGNYAQEVQKTCELLGDLEENSDPLDRFLAILEQTQVEDQAQTAYRMNLARLRIIVADDNPKFLQRLVSLLATEFDVVASAADGKSALDVIRHHKPDVVVLDLDMPALNGIEVTKQLTKNVPHPSVVICSVETDPEVVEAARNAGALSYVFKMRIEKDLVLAVKSAFHCKFFVSPGPL